MFMVTFGALVPSKSLRDLERDSDRSFGKVSERARFSYTQVWP